MNGPVTPRFKLMLFYDLTAEETEAYYRFVMTDMVPTLQGLGLYIFRVFHTIPGLTPNGHCMRQVEFVAEDLSTIHAVLDSAAWGDFEDKLMQHATNYTKKVVRFRQGFQL